MNYCENCNKLHNGKYGSGRFCGAYCARGYSTKFKRKEINKKVSNTLKGRKLKKETIEKLKEHKHTITTKNLISKNTKGKNKTFSNEDNRIIHLEKISKSVKEALDKLEKIIPNSILEISKRTTSKILRRLNIGCSRCGWNEDICDIHHIYGRKIENANNHKNLCYLCPNCHRLANNNKILPNELISIYEYVGDNWKLVYYGKIKPFMDKR